MVMTCLAVSLTAWQVAELRSQLHQGLASVHSQYEVLRREVTTSVSLTPSLTPKTAPSPYGAQEPRGLYLGDGVVFCHAQPLGYPLMLEASDKGLTVHICRGLGWEPDTSAWFRSILRPGMYVLDVGANVGYFTLLFSRLVGATGHVTAVEANPRTFDLVSTSVELSGLSKQVKVLAYAVVWCFDLGFECLEMTATDA
jgi:hypothetical protein